MDSKKLNRIWELLRNLAASREFEALNISGTSANFRRFALDLHHAILRSSPTAESPPTRDELRGLLTWLLSQCVEELAVFRPQTEKVIEVIDR